MPLFFARRSFDVFLQKMLDKRDAIPYNKRALKINGEKKKSAGVAHLVERHLAKVEVASSSLVFRSNLGDTQ